LLSRWPLAQTLGNLLLMDADLVFDPVEALCQLIDLGGQVLLVPPQEREPLLLVPGSIPFYAPIVDAL